VGFEFREGGEGRDVEVLTLLQEAFVDFFGAGLWEAGIMDESDLR
jgi:hypothetical protein